MSGEESCGCCGETGRFYRVTRFSEAHEEGGGVAARTGGLASRLARGSDAMSRHAPCHHRRRPAVRPSERAMGAAMRPVCASGSAKKSAPAPGAKGDG